MTRAGRGQQQAEAEADAEAEAEAEVQLQGQGRQLQDPRRKEEQVREGQRPQTRAGEVPAPPSPLRSGSLAPRVQPAR